MTEIEIINRILKGDELLFKELIESYKDQVLRICYGFTQSQYDAEDIAQEVFVEVYQSLQTFRNESKFSTWIYRIAVNKSLNHLRKQKRRAIFKSVEDFFGGNSARYEKADESSQPDDFTDPDQDIKMLKEAIKKLPDAQKTALMLYTYQELSYKKIAEVMNLSLASVESLIFRSKKNLRKLLINNSKSED